jgi:membrane protease YdiL (CAAX protease family)
MGASSESAERWGLTDALTGLAASVVLAGLVGAAVISARGDYTGKWSEHGAAAGRSAAQLATDGTLKAPQLTPLWLITLLQVPLWVGLLGTVFYAASKGRGVVADFGLRMRASDIGVGLLVGFLAQVVVIPLVYWPLLRLLGEPDVSAEARSLTDRAHGFGVVLLVLLTVVGAPIVEELFFRGLFLRSLGRRWNLTVGVIVTSLVFGLFHAQGSSFAQAAFIVLVTAGYGTVFALVVIKADGRLGPSIIGHMIVNTVGVLATFLL